MVRVIAQHEAKTAINGLAQLSKLRITNDTSAHTRRSELILETK